MGLFQWYSNRSTFFRKFGLLPGYFISNKIFPLKKEVEKVSVYIPRYRRKIYLRTNTSDISTFTKVLVDEEYFFKINFKPLLIIDAGANIGLSALYFAHLFPKAKIVTVEPETGNLELLTENLKGLNYSPLHGALWNRKTKLTIKDPNANVSGYQVIESQDKFEIDAYSVQDILLSIGAVDIDILKIDIEGAEVEVFSENFHNWLPRTKVLIIETHDRFRPGCTETLLKAISNYNFQMSEKGENIYFINNDYQVQIEL